MASHHDILCHLATSPDVSTKPLSKPLSKTKDEYAKIRYNIGLLFSELIKESRDTQLHNSKSHDGNAIA